PWESMLKSSSQADDGHDPRLQEAVELVRRTESASASLLQRRMSIGYPRAASLIDQMEGLGIIGPATGGGRTRQVFQPDEDDEWDAG
ncbi:MAG: DNA translocase FtsK, partial [Delftia sp.]|nr:DNA translocase FtsK [Delftia sp.]